LPLAKKIQSKIVEILGTTDRGTKTANFAVLRETAMPAVLGETAFISNKLFFNIYICKIGVLTFTSLCYVIDISS